MVIHSFTHSLPQRESKVEWQQRKQNEAKMELEIQKQAELRKKQLEDLKRREEELQVAMQQQKLYLYCGC